MMGMESGDVLGHEPMGIVVSKRDLRYGLADAVIKKAITAHRLFVRRDPPEHGKLAVREPGATLLLAVICSVYESKNAFVDGVRYHSCGQF